ncbi:MAG: putative membrane protein YdjX (TVP38/TMEM64 family) [Lysobacterales bacterium]|jgi:uncharacterized membrane protein YdjX (TVP38/TMEM64 family)
MAQEGDILLNKRNPLVKWLGFIFIIVIITTVSFVYKDNISAQQLHDLMQLMGLWAPILFIALYILISGFLVPSVVFKVLAGTLYGVLNGAFIVSVAAVISSLIKFILARYFFQESVARKIGENTRWQMISRVIEKDGWKMLLLLRNVPVLSGLFLNYICGVSRMPARNFVLASFIGRLPQIFMCTYLGHLLGYATGLESNSQEHLVTEWVMFILGLIAAIVASLYTMRLAKKVLAEEGIKG